MSNFKRARKYLIAVFLIAVLAVSVLALQLFYLYQRQTTGLSVPYVGIAFCGNTTTQAKTQIDRAKSYTNLFVLDTGRSDLSRNQSAVYEICDYAVNSGLSVILNLGISDPHENDSVTWFWEQSLDDVKRNWTERWGDKFLGVYDNDEPGGIQLDGDWKGWYAQYGKYLSQMDHPAMDNLYKIYLKMLDAHEGSLPQDYDLEAEFFVKDVLVDGDPGLAALKNSGITTFTSDYGLYWFDYLGDYDVLLAQIGWNVSVAQQIALIKGAARLQEKDWGIIVTWKYGDTPFLDSGDQIYSQMITAYQAGADYIVIFDYAKDNNGNSAHAMLDEHYDALERLWNDMHTGALVDLSGPEAALVLPANYGWGMRNPDDTIWGFWPADEKAEVIGEAMSKLLAKYGAELDIVYEDTAYPVSKAGYGAVYYWNQTIR